jgi:hypothetical protein
MLSFLTRWGSDPLVRADGTVSSRLALREGPHSMPLFAGVNCLTLIPDRAEPGVGKTAAGEVFGCADG